VVVLAGVGVDQVVKQSGSSSTSSAPAGAAADRGAAAPEDATPTGPEPDGGGSADKSAQGSVPTAGDSTVRGYLDGAPPVRIHPQRFSQDVVLARKALAALKKSGRTDLHDSQSLRDAGGCRRTAWGAGRYVPARYGAAAGYLVFRKPAGDTQVVDLYLCGARDAVRSVTLPHS
jgi:hypothetical protein